MKIEFNQARLRKLMIDFYNCTQIPITLFGSDFKCIFGYGRAYPYCTHMRNFPELLEKCTRSDEEHFLEAKEQKRTIVYTCHAGVCETITPIFYENVIIAYLMLGKFRDEGQIYSSPKIAQNCLKNYGLDMKQKMKEYRDLPVISEDFLNSAISILKICIRYIWSENLIQLNKNMLPAQIENYILENLALDLTIDDICKKFFISKQTLYTIFRDEFNDTVKNFVNAKRLHEAEKLLIETKLPISAISEKVGFIDYNYFIRQFKKKLGITPLQYRKTHLESAKE